MESKHFSWDDLLKPTQFDWAEDVEEGLEETTDNLLKPTQFDWADEVEDEMVGDTKIKRELDGGKGEEDTVMGDATQTAKEEPRGPLIVNGAVDMTAGVGSGEQETDSGTSTDFDGEIESMQLAVNGEFVYRQACLQADSDGIIHHFNWFGDPVYEHNPTPPAISLLFLLTDPKVPPSGHEWRYESIMKRAMVFVDPVMAYVDNGWEDMCKRGFDLVRWSTGRVYKFYSPHGKWVEDVKDLEEFPVLDDGDLVNYASDNAIASNGFIDQFSIRSRSQWVKSRDECFYMAHREQKSRLKGFGSSSSPLRQSMMPSEFDVEDEHVEDFVLEGPPSRLTRKRSSHESSCPPVGGLKRRASICDFKSELAGLAGESSEIGGSRVDDFVRLSVEEKELAEDIKSRKLLKKKYCPVFTTVGEEDECPEDAGSQDQIQPQHSKYVSTGTQTELSRPVSSTSLVDSTPVDENAGLQAGKKQALVYLSQKNKKWKKSLHRLTNKTRDILRSKKPQFTLAPEPATASQSSQSSSSSSTSLPGKEAGSSTNSSVVIVSHADSGFGEQHTSSSTSKPRHTPEENGKALWTKKTLTTKLKKTLRRSSSEHKSTAPGHKSAFPGFCKDFFYDGIWALERYPVYPLIL